MPLVATAWHAPAEPAPIERYLAVLDAHGVSHAVLAAASLFGTDNTYPIACCQAHPRLRTTVIVDPDISVAELRQLDAAGAVGIRLQYRSTPELPDLHGQAYQRLFARVADLGWHVQVHDHSARLGQILDAVLPVGLPIVVDHFGRPSEALGPRCPGFQRLLRAVDGGHTWVKLSASFRMPARPMLQDCANALLAHAGPQRLMWGSDWPFVAMEAATTYAQTLTSLDELVRDPQVRRRVLWDTPWQLYFCGTAA